MSKKLFNAKQEVKDIVFGYIKQRIATLLPNVNIAKVVEYLCLKYYYVQRDAWDIGCVSQFLTLNGDTLYVGRKKESDLHTYLQRHRGRSTVSETGTSSFLKESIKCGTFTWKFRIDSTKLRWQRTYNSTIGIWKVNDDIKPEKVLDENCFVRPRARQYAFGYAFGVGRLKSNGDDYKYGICCVKGDTVEMMLDLNRMELRFSVNGVDLGKAFDVEKGCYRAVVNMSRYGDSITLL